ETALDSTFTLGWIGTRGAQDSTSARQNTGYALQVERFGLVFEYATPAFGKADEIVPIVKDTLTNNRPDNGIQPRAVSATRQDTDLHCRIPISKIYVAIL